MQRHLLLIIYQIFIISGLTAQSLSNQKIFEFTPEFGLSNGKVHDITQDLHGFIWIATEEGVTRYDGKQVKKYVVQEQDPKYGLSHNNVYALAADNNYGVWIGTSAGLDAYNHKTGTFSKYSFYTKQGTPLLKPVWQIVPFANNVCILRSDSKELYVYKPGNDTIKAIVSPSFKPTHIPNFIDSIASQTVVVGDKGGLLYTLHASGRVIIIDTLPHSISCVKMLINNILAVADVYGNLYFYKNNNCISTIQFPNQKVSNSEKNISSIEQISSDELIIGTRASGVFRVLISAKKIEELSYNSEIINQHVEKVFKDSFQNMWFAHSYGGVSVALNQYQIFGLLQLPQQVYEQKILTIYKQANILYIGTDGNGMFIYNTKNKQLQQVNYETGYKGYEFDNVVTSISSDGKRIWIATYNKGIFAIDIATNSLVYIDELKQIPASNFSNIYCDTQQKVWIGTYEHGVYVFDIQKKKIIKHYTSMPENSPEALSCNGVTCFFEDASKNMWIGSYYGISKIHSNGFVTRYTVQNHKGLKNNFITTFAQDTKGNIWIATKQGLSVYNSKQDSLHVFELNHYLHKKQIQSLYMQDSILWIVSEYSLFSMNLQTHSIQEFATSNVGEITREAFIVDSNMWYIGAEKAILTVIPKSLVPLQKTQTIQLSDVLLQGKSIFSADTKTKVEYIDNQYHIYLSGKEDNIAIYFSDFEWNIQNNNEYEYILENYMDDWALLHDANFVNFTKLSGGDYVLRIKKKYQDSSSHDELVVHIHIQKAFWEYWFFYVSLVLLLIGLIYIIYIVRVQSIISMRNSLQQQVEQRMSEIQNKIERIQEQEERIRQQDADFLIQQEIQSKLEQDIETQKQTYELAIQQKDIEIEESKKQTQAVSELKELVEKNFHLLENNTREMVFRIILPSEMFDYVSPAVESFTGYTPQEFYSDSMMFRKLIISEGKDDFKKFRKYMIEGKVPPVMEYKIITKSGKEKWVAQYSTIIRDAKQQPIALEAVLVDISEKKELEQRNNALKKRAKKLEKIEGDFSETQNINTVKQALHVFADLLKREDVSLDEKQAFLESNQESGSFALHMIENFIDISKIEAGKIHFNYSQCYVNTVLQELLDSFTESKQYIGKKHIQLTMNVPSLEENFSFYTDTFRFRQVMMNLLGNAIKFTHSGSVEFGYEIIENVKAENNIELVFFVKDTGEGIPAEKLDLLFNTDMQSEDSEFMGGLGLTVSKKIVELLGGRMWAESELEKGTIIRFTLPVEKMKGFKKAEQQVTEKLVETIDWSQKTLLLVEDEENNYDLVREVLAKTNIQILWAQNGEEGVEMFKQNQRDIDVILMDIQMPIMNGYTATQEIKKIDKDIPIIAQTAYANYDSKLNCIKVGCENYIEKPYKRKDLIDMLSKYL